MQCDRCGQGLQERPKAGVDLAALPEFDNAKFIAWQQRDAEARNRERLTGARERDDGWWERYNAYLLTDHWRQVRRIVLQRDSVCQACFTAASEECHHVSYKGFNRWGISFPVECAGVCQPCHERLHGEDA
jgi:hypothetical protein